MEGIKNFIQNIINYVFPHRKNEARLSKIGDADFNRLAVSLLHGREKDGFLILFEYKDKLVKDALWEMKFHGNKKVVKMLALQLYDRLLEELAEAKDFLNFTNPLLIPIPVSRKTLYERGWNQCELLAKELCHLDNNLNFEVRSNVLSKRKHIEDQVGKSKKNRFKNIEGCFEVINQKTIEGRNIIIIDDIVTTGATMNEAKKVLKNAGAKNILCVALAH